MSCLIIKNDGIGDLILASGLISAVGKFFDGKVDLVTCTENRELAEGIEPLREVFYCSRDSMKLSTARHTFSRIWQVGRKYAPQMPESDKQVMRTLSKRRYDVIICLRRFVRQSTLVIMQQVDGLRKYCECQFSSNADLEMMEYSMQGWQLYEGPYTMLSELDVNKSFLEKILAAEFDHYPNLSYCHRQTAALPTQKIALGLSGSGSALWPYGNWIELAMRLARAGWRLVLFGGKDVTDLGEKIADKVPAAENCVGRLSWRQTAEGLSDCRGYIGNDTGLSHFASLILEKCLIIMGGGTFRRFFPWPAADNQYLIFHGLDCFDCTWCCKYRDRFCLSLVRPAEVEQYFAEVMRGGAPGERDLNSRNEQYQVVWKHGRRREQMLVRSEDSGKPALRRVDQPMARAGENS